jgi:transcriptional regulator with PAS, ATPase and Fis domain
MGLAPFEITDEEMRFLQSYDWPGNVRELRNLIERSLIVGALNVSALYQSQTTTTKTALSGKSGASEASSSGKVSAAPTAAQPVDLQTLEKRHILSVLDSVGGDKTRAAHLLGVSRRTLERRVADWGQA